MFFFVAKHTENHQKNLCLKKYPKGCPKNCLKSLLKNQETNKICQN